MTASQVNSMRMFRGALAGWPGSSASTISDIPFRGGDKLGYDCAIPATPYAVQVPDEEHPSETGKRVLVGDINRIIRQASLGIYMRKLGASNEFDERVVEIDKGAKSESSEDYGYPYGAVIDWWNGSSFSKVICIRNEGTAITTGNCKVGPDDPVHGVNGTGTKFWQRVSTVSKIMTFTPPMSWNDTMVFENNTFKFASLFQLIWTYTTSTGKTGHVYAVAMAKEGDTLTLSGNKAYLNSTYIQYFGGNITTSPSGVSITSSTVEKGFLRVMAYLAPST